MKKVFTYMIIMLIVLLPFACYMHSGSSVADEVYGSSVANEVYGATNNGNSSNSVSGNTYETGSSIPIGLELSPANQVVCEGEIAFYQALLTFADGHQVTVNDKVYWAYGPIVYHGTEQLTIEAPGAFRATEGAYWISAGYGSFTARATLLVTPSKPVPKFFNVPNIADNETFFVGSERWLAAYCGSEDWNSRNVTKDTEWSVSNSGVAELVPKGDYVIIKFIGLGTTVVKATYQGVEKTMTVWVVKPPPVEIEPAEMTITPGGRVPLRVFIKYEAKQAEVLNKYPYFPGIGVGAGELEINPVTAWGWEWTSDDSNVAKVVLDNGQWKVFGLSPGGTTVRTTYQLLRGAARVVVYLPSNGDSGGSQTTEPKPDKLEVTPKTLDLLVGDSGRLTATLYWDNGKTENVTAKAVWSSDASGIATVDSGLVTGVSVGKASVTAAYAGFSDAATVTVRELTGKVFGYVKDKNGKPVAGARVELHSEPRVAVTDEKGYYEFQDVPFGKHTILITDARLEQVQRIDIILDAGGQRVVQENSDRADVQLARADREKRVDFVVVPKAAAPVEEKHSQQQVAEEPAPQAQSKPEPSPKPVPKNTPEPQPTPAPQPEPHPTKPEPQPQPAPEPEPQPSPAKRLPWWPILLLLPPLLLLRAVIVSADPDPENPEGAIVKRGSFGPSSVRVRVYITDRAGSNRIDMVYLARRDQYRITSARYVAVKTPGWINLARQKKFNNPAA